MSAFAGRVDSVNALLGQQVKKGQVLATVFIPELVDQQANLSIAQEALTLAQQDYQREKQLFDQGVSARQDYQKPIMPIVRHKYRYKLRVVAYPHLGQVQAVRDVIP